MKSVDPVEQSTLWMKQFMAATHNHDWPNPPHSICFSVLRSMFTNECTLDDLETVLQNLLAEKVKPSAYRWLAKEIRDAFEDAAHERRTKRSEVKQA